MIFFIIYLQGKTIKKEKYSFGWGYLSILFQLFISIWWLWTYLERSRLTRRGCTGACWELRSPGRGQCAPPWSPWASAHLSARRRSGEGQEAAVRLTRSPSNSYAPGTPEQRWRCCLRRRPARGKAQPGGWPARRGRRSTSRSPWRRGLNSPPPGSHPDPPETWSPPGRRPDQTPLASMEIVTVPSAAASYLLCCCISTANKPTNVLCR